MRSCFKTLGSSVAGHLSERNAVNLAERYRGVFAKFSWSRSHPSFSQERNCPHENIQRIFSGMRSLATFSVLGIQLIRTLWNPTIAKKTLTRIEESIVM